MTILSEYRTMWVVVLFDLPTVSKSEKTAYRKFHTFLLEDGFTRVQYSVYGRHCASRELATTAGIAVPGLTSAGASTNDAIASSDSREPTSASESRGFTANARDVCPGVERRWQPMQLSSVIRSKPPSASTTGSEADRWKRSNT